MAEETQKLRQNLKRWGYDSLWCILIVEFHLYWGKMQIVLLFYDKYYFCSLFQWVYFLSLKLSVTLIVWFFMRLSEFEKAISRMWTFDLYSYMSYKQKYIYFTTLNCLFLKKVFYYWLNCEEITFSFLKVFKNWGLHF